MIALVAETIEALERRIDELRVAVREAVLAGDRALAGAAPLGPQVGRAGLGGRARRGRRGAGRTARQTGSRTRASRSRSGRAARPPGSLLPLREQVYEALSLLQVPAAPKLIATVHEAFFGATFPTTRVTSLKRDEERSFRTAPFARPYYICAALSADYLAPSRGLLAVSTWPLELRVDRLAVAAGRLPDGGDPGGRGDRADTGAARRRPPPAAAVRGLRLRRDLPRRRGRPGRGQRGGAGRADRPSRRRRQGPPRGGRAGARPAPGRAAVRHRHVPRPSGRRGRPAHPADQGIAGKAAGE